LVLLTSAATPKPHTRARAPSLQELVLKNAEIDKARKLHKDLPEGNMD
jgi:hypothetical protein